MLGGFLEINPEDVRALGPRHGDSVRVVSMGGGF